MTNLCTKRKYLPLILMQAWMGLALMAPSYTYSQDVPVLTKEAEKLESTFHEYDALQKYKEILHTRLQT